MMNPQNLIRVLIVDDEEIVRYGLKAIFKSKTVVEVAGEACNGKEAIRQAQALQPDVVLMDIGMPVMDGQMATRAILQAMPHIKVLILTTHNDGKCLIEAIQQGAAGYLLKSTSPEDLIQAIQAIHKGYVQFSPGIGQKLSRQIKSYQSLEPSTSQKDVFERVTPREKEVLHLLSEGASNQEIAQRLQIAEKTVKNHVSNLLKRMNFRDRIQLAIWVNQSAASTRHHLSE